MRQILCYIAAQPSWSQLTAELAERYRAAGVVGAEARCEIAGIMGKWAPQEMMNGTMLESAKMGGKRSGNQGI